MSEVATWTTLGRWLLSLARFIPDRVLRWAWSGERLLRAIEVFHFEQSPRFWVRPERGAAELSLIGFNVCNFSPFAPTLVGAELTVTMDGRELFEYRSRFASEIPTAPYARSGFHFKHIVADSLAIQLRAYPSAWTIIRINGTLILRSIFGELRREIHSDIVAVIDR
jgi:hypothetical protein